MKTSIKIAQQWVSSYTRSAHQLAGCYCSTFLFAFCVCNCVNIYACVIVKACCCLYIYAQCNNASTFSILGIFFFIAPLGLLFLPHSTFHCCAVVAFVCTKIPQPCLFLGLKIFLDIHEYVLMYEYMCVCISIFYPTILIPVLFFCFQQFSQVFWISCCNWILWHGMQLLPFSGRDNCRLSIYC